MANLFPVFIDSLATASHCSKLRHPNIVQFLGASVDPPDLLLVTEFLDRGSLSDIFANSKVVLCGREEGSSTV